MDTTRYMKIGHKKVMKPEYFKTLPAHRALTYYKKHVVGIPSGFCCECCGMRTSVKNGWTKDGNNNPSVEKQRKVEDQLLQYRDNMKAILDKKNHVE